MHSSKSGMIKYKLFYFIYQVNLTSPCRSMLHLKVATETVVLLIHIRVGVKKAELSECKETSLVLYLMDDKDVFANKNGSLFCINKNVWKEWVILPLSNGRFWYTNKCMCFQNHIKVCVGESRKKVQVHEAINIKENISIFRSTT